MPTFVVVFCVCSQARRPPPRQPPPPPRGALRSRLRRRRSRPRMSSASVFRHCCSRAGACLTRSARVGCARSCGPSRQTQTHPLLPHTRHFISPSVSLDFPRFPLEHMLQRAPERSSECELLALSVKLTVQPLLLLGVSSPCVLCFVFALQQPRGAQVVCRLRGARAHLRGAARRSAGPSYNRAWGWLGHSKHLKRRACAGLPR